MIEKYKNDNKHVQYLEKEANRRFEESRRTQLEILRYLKTLCEFGRVMKEISDRLTQIDYIYEVLIEKEVGKDKVID